MIQNATQIVAEESSFFFFFPVKAVIQTYFANSN